MTQVEMPQELMQYAAMIAAAAPMILHPAEMEGWEDQAWMDGLHSLMASQAKDRWQDEFAQAFAEEMEMA